MNQNKTIITALHAVARPLILRHYAIDSCIGSTAIALAALRAFGVGPGERVLVGSLPGHHEVVASLAVARLGAVRWYAEASADALAAVLEEAGPRVAVLPTKADVDLGELPLITVDDSTELSWGVVMRAGRTDPAGCADVTAPGVLAVIDGEVVTVLDALQGSGGASTLDVGGLSLWVHP